MRRAVILLIVFGLFVARPKPASAMHQAGHMAIARIAWKELSDKERSQCARLLKAHPHYRVYLTAGCPKDVPEIEWAFMRASTWSDWVRGPSGSDLNPEARSQIRSKYNKPVWHYVNLPYVHPKDVGRFDAAAIRKHILEPEFDDAGEPRHVLAALKLSMRQLGNADASAEDKSIALCWLLHLVGDLHQPLHGTSLIASKETFDPPFDPPHGDLGGNRLTIRKTAADTKAVNLHFYWDALLFRDDTTFAEIETAVTGFTNDLKRDRLNELKATEFLAWAEESLDLAKKVVYQADGAFLKARPVGDRTSAKRATAPVLPAGYHKAAEAVARRRMVLAGYRIADQIHYADLSKER